jgi:hypothetical protein
MSTVLTRPRTRAREDLGAQDSLFGEPAAAPRPPAPTRDDERTSAHDRGAPAGPTLEQAVTAIWAELTAGQTAACPVCRSVMAPGHDAGAGIVGARCTSCATTLA